MAHHVLAGSPPALAEELAKEITRLCGVLSHPAAARSRTDVVRDDHALRGREREKLSRVVDLVAEIDALISMARATTRWEWTFPELVDGEAFLLGLDWRTFGDGPRFEHAVNFEAEIIMDMRGVMALNDKSSAAVALVRSVRLRCCRQIALGLVVL